MQIFFPPKGFFSRRTQSELCICAGTEPPIHQHVSDYAVQINQSPDVSETKASPLCPLTASHTGNYQHPTLSSLSPAPLRIISGQRNTSPDFNKLVYLQLTFQENKGCDMDLQRVIPTPIHPTHTQLTAFGFLLSLCLLCAKVFCSYYSV